MPTDVGSRAASGASAQLHGMAVALAPIRMPAQVDQPQVVVRLVDGSVAVLEQERWASPLPDEFREALLEQLIVGHGAIDARTRPGPAAPAWRVAIDVRRFDSLPGREARIEGSWTIDGGAGASSASSRCEWLFREPASGALDELAAAHRRAIVRLADAIAAALARARGGEAPACPSLEERG